MNFRVLVCGAGGYIGLPLCAELVRRGYQVRALDTWWFGKYPNQCEIIRCDTRDFQPLYLKDVDAVIDLAGLSNDAAGDLDPELTYSINVDGAKIVANAACRAGIKHYIYSSSCSVYGSSEKKNLTVNAECHPLTAYAASKVKVEDYLRDIADHSFRPIILRNGTVYGISERMRFDLVVNNMARTSALKSCVVVGGSGMQWRPFVHIDDLIHVFCEALKNNNAYTLNVVFENYQIAAVAGTIASIERVPIHYAAEAGPDQRSYHVQPLLLPHKSIREAAYAMIAGIENKTLDAMDPTSWTVSWYKTLPQFQDRMTSSRVLSTSS